MEAPEEAMSSSSSSEATGDSGDATASVVVVKGKRTKRQRIHPPAPATSPAAPDSCSASEAASGIITDEEDDMAANCLMLLAQGGGPFRAEQLPRESATEEGGCARGTSTEKFTTSRRFTETATTTEGKIGYYVYECKTCNKCFPSFQALGGHRASHTKPRLAVPLAATATTAGDKRDITGDDMLQITMSSLARQTPDTKPKVHECAICGAQFNSGQALGGHMRRHRPLVYNVEGGVRKERSLLSLDLNLPAPAGDELQRPRSSPAPEFSLNSKPPLFFRGAHGELPLLR